MSVEKVRVSRCELLMDAGFGAQKAGDILMTGFAHVGKYVFIEPLIPAEISPPPRSAPSMSGVILRLAEFDITNIGNNTDFMIAQHEVVLNRRLDDEEHNPKCRVLLDMGDKKGNEETYEKVCKRVTDLGLSIYPFEITPVAQEAIKALGGKGKNMFYLGMLGAIYLMPEDVLTQEITHSFGKKLNPEILAKNISLFTEGYRFAKENVHFSYEVESKAQKEGDHVLIDGNSALSLGIIDAGIKLISGYPITPATSILHTLAKIFPAYGGMVHQAEDEISAIGTAIGAYYGGIPAITASSGPGISLNQEFIGYATVAEIPIIIIDVQRSGPSTGMPTKTEQSDLMAAVFGSHGDNTKIVISVGNVIDCFYAPKLARYLAEKLRMPIFIMSDFQIANSYKVIDKPKVTGMEKIEDIDDFIFDHFGIDRLPENIEMVRRVQANPGTPEMMRRVTGLNTDKEGKVNYFAKTNQRAHEARNNKVHIVSKALREPEFFGGVKDGDLLICGWGATRGSIQEAVDMCQREGLKVGGICFKVVYPLPHNINHILARFKKVITVEMAYGDEQKQPPLAMFLRSSSLRDVKAVVSRATGRPVTPRMIYNCIKEALVAN